MLLLSAGVLQTVVAVAVGTPLPSRLFDLWLAFTLVCVAFLGLGLLITMLADTVPAAQALGQVVFLPMLIVGGVAVPLQSLPAWVQHVAAALPGRHAVDALDAAISGRGLAVLGPDVAALAVMGVASGLAAIAIFRWDVAQRVGVLRTLLSVGLAVGSWITVGAVRLPIPAPSGD